MKTVLIIVCAIVLLNVVIAAVFFLLKRKSENNVSKGKEKQEPTTMPSVGDNLVIKPEIKPEKPIKDLTPIYHVGDKITNGETTGTITKITKVCYKLDCGVNVPLTEQEKWTLYEPEPQNNIFDNIMRYFFGDDLPSELVCTYLSSIYDSAENQYQWQKSCSPLVYDQNNFPSIIDYYTNDDFQDADERLYAWLFAMVLADLMPEKRNEWYQKGYDYKQKGKEIPIYGWSFDTDPNICIMVAAQVWAMTRQEDLIPALRKELGSKMISYKQDVSELYIDICKFLPSAPAPYLDAYSKRNEFPVDCNVTEDIDKNIHNYICLYYNLDSKDKDFRQATIQAISNKEYKKPHLFGKQRTVTDHKYGEMTFNPVFGKHNIGIEIPDNGAIANLCYEVGKVCTDSRKPLLDQEYGRRRPGQGDTDPSANKDAKQRALVNYAIEEGDGHTTGYYNQNGDYVDGNGNHIGDYETYYQGQLYANSYPSGHSAFIEGVALVLSLIMSEKADLVEKAKNEFAISRCICRYHWPSDTIIGRVVGTMMLPVLCATTNFDFERKLKEAKKEYQAILNGETPVEEKVNTSLSYVCGGYGSCHVDAGETSLNHYCNKEAKKERHPFINVSQKVEFTIEGAGVKTADGKTFGTWSANKDYELVCPAVAEGEEKVAKITMRNEHGVRVLNYKLSRNGTHDDGCNNY